MYFKEPFFRNATLGNRKIANKALSKRTVPFSFIMLLKTDFDFAQSDHHPERSGRVRCKFPRYLFLCFPTFFPPVPANVPSFCVAGIR